MITRANIITYYNVSTSKSGIEALIDLLITDAYEAIEALCGVDISNLGVCTEKRIKELSKETMQLTFEPLSITSITREATDIITADVDVSGSFINFVSEQDTTAYSGTKSLLEYVIVYTPVARVISQIDNIAKEYIGFYLTKSSYSQAADFQMSKTPGQQGMSARYTTEQEFRDYFEKAVAKLVGSIS